jgi:hypothetical protein
MAKHICLPDLAFIPESSFDPEMEMTDNVDALALDICHKCLMYHSNLVLESLENN